MYIELWNGNACSTLPNQSSNLRASWGGNLPSGAVARFRFERSISSIAPGEPSVVIMSVQDFIRPAAPLPDWLTKAWAGAKRRGLDTLAR